MALESMLEGSRVHPAAAASAFHAGFLPDLSHGRVFRGLGITRDLLTPLSPLVTRRDVIVSDGSGVSARILVYVAGDDGLDARAALGVHLATLTQRPRLEPGARHQLPIGDFALVEPSAAGLIHVVFGRGNVVVDIAPWGAADAPLEGMARNLDDQLRASPVYDRASFDTRKPRIEALHFSAPSVVPQGFTPLVVSARCPEGGALQYDFVTSSGAVDWVAKSPPRFLYESGGASGPQQITAHVTAASGLTSVARLDFGVGTDPLAGLDALAGL